MNAARSVARHATPYPLPRHRDPRTVTRYDDAVLDPLRHRGDDATDALIDKIAAIPSDEADAPQADAARSNGVRDFYRSLLEGPKVLDLVQFEGKPYWHDL